MPRCVGCGRSASSDCHAARPPVVAAARGARGLCGVSHREGKPRRRRDSARSLGRGCRARAAPIRRRRHDGRRSCVTPTARCRFCRRCAACCGVRAACCFAARVCRACRVTAARPARAQLALQGGLGGRCGGLQPGRRGAARHISSGLRAPRRACVGGAPRRRSAVRRSAAPRVPRAHCHRQAAGGHAARRCSSAIAVSCFRCGVRQAQAAGGPSTSGVLRAALPADVHAGAERGGLRSRCAGRSCKCPCAMAVACLPVCAC